MKISSKEEQNKRKRRKLCAITGNEWKKRKTEKSKSLEEQKGEKKRKGVGQYERMNEYQREWLNMNNEKRRRTGMTCTVTGNKAKEEGTLNNKRTRRRSERN